MPKRYTDQDLNDIANMEFESGPARVHLTPQRLLSAKFNKSYCRS